MFVRNNYNVKFNVAQGLFLFIVFPIYIPVLYILNYMYVSICICIFFSHCFIHFSEKNSWTNPMQLNLMRFFIQS